MSECGHSSCSRRNYVTFCLVADSERRRKERRARGIPAWSDRTPEAYLKQQIQVERWHQLHPEQWRRKARRYKAWCKEKFGGRIDRDPVAREKWLVWRAEQKRLKLENQIETRRAYANTRASQRKLGKRLPSLAR